MLSDEYSFALCLTHDVDRPYKRLHQALYYAITERSLDHLRSVVGSENPYWQFDDIMRLEDDLGVRSAFYFLQEPSLRSLDPRAWLQPDTWVQQLGRYDLQSPEIAAVIRRLDAEGWEVGLHGSYHTAQDPDRLETEKRRLESVLGHEPLGIRQHYLRLEVPHTWEIQASLGFQYDASLGSSTTYGFDGRYGLFRPLKDSFVVFPLTLMEQSLPDPETKPDAAWEVGVSLLEEAAANEAIMTVLWHPRYFNETEFPGYRSLYRRLVERALDAGAWVGSPAALLEQLDTLGQFLTSKHTASN